MIKRDKFFLLTIIVFVGLTFVHSSVGAQDKLEITLKKPRHQHLYHPAQFKFKVMQGENGVTGLKPVISYQGAGAKTGKTASLTQGQIVDAGKGEYHWAKAFSAPGGYALTFSFTQQGRTYFRTFVHGLALAGGERIFRPSKAAPKYKYQIRWQAKPSNVPVGEDVSFLVELKRTVEGAKINVERPFRNTFDHLTPSKLKGSPTITLKGAGEGSEIKLSPVYKGLGVYEVRHKFDPQEAGKKYQLRVAFTDGADFKVDETGEDYQFPVGGSD
jgi:hypothetical protein